MKKIFIFSIFIINLLFSFKYFSISIKKEIIISDISKIGKKIEDFSK